jgi:hypothetical protein
MHSGHPTISAQQLLFVRYAIKIENSTSDIQSAQIGECCWEYILQIGDGAMAHR